MAMNQKLMRPKASAAPPPAPSPSPPPPAAQSLWKAETLSPVYHWSI